MMGDTPSGVVARRTLSVVCHLLRESDPRPYWLQSPYGAILRSKLHSCRAAPRSPKVGSWAEERRSRSWLLCEGLVQFGVGLVGPFSDVDKLLALSDGNLDIISASSSFGRHSPSVCDSLRRLLEEFIVFSCVEVFSDPEVDSPLHWKIWIFNEPLVSDSHLPRMRQLEALDEFHTFSSSRWTPVLRTVPRALATRCSQAVAAGGVFGGFDTIFRTPSSWTSGARFQEGSRCTINLDDLWPYTFCRRARVQNNNNNPNATTTHNHNTQHTTHDTHNTQQGSNTLVFPV